MKRNSLQHRLPAFALGAIADGSIAQAFRAIPTKLARANKGPPNPSRHSWAAGGHDHGNQSEGTANRASGGKTWRERNRKSQAVSLAVGDRDHSRSLLRASCRISISITDLRPNPLRSESESPPMKNSFVTTTPLPPYTSILLRRAFLKLDCGSLALRPAFRTQ